MSIVDFRFIILFMIDNEELIRKNIKLLLDRLERLSADSIWAHRASGLRGSLIKSYEKYHRFNCFEEVSHIEGLIEQGFSILAAAASTIQDYNS